MRWVRHPHRYTAAVAVYNPAKRTLRVLPATPPVLQRMEVFAGGWLVSGPAQASIQAADTQPRGELDAAARRAQNKMWV